MSDEYLPINTHFDVQSGFAFPSTVFVESGIPIVRMSDLKTGKLKFENAKYVNESWLNTASPFILKPGDFLLGMSGSLSNYAAVTEDDVPALLNQRVGRLRQRDNSAEYEYVCYWLKSSIYARYADIQGEGAAQKNISSKQIGQFQYRATSLAKQKKISIILGSLEVAIEKTEVLIHKYQQIKAGLMHDLFTRGLTADGKLRPPREQAPELYQETRIGWIPKEWEVKRVGELCFSIVPGRDKPILDGGDLPWITVSDIEFLYVSDSKEGLSLSKSSLNKAHGRIIPKGAVVMSCVGSFGLVAITDKELVMNQQLHAFVVGDQIIQEWLVFNLERQETYMSKIATQTTIHYLNKTACESVPIVVPTKNEQQRLTEIIKSISDQIIIEQQVAIKLKKQKSGLMHDLLTGKVPVTIDPAELAHV